eukprot:TRINITY_DN3106_c0_g1_i1.p2 TRINITY_DN3106_c0_g1~~TRINITY_DN3106_c0_g1_i1.p2  ORF type:complete len:416 (-),score=90.57 TRINITY_DN3106_c0_g1_i1:4028-5275(-)
MLEKDFRILKQQLHQIIKEGKDTLRKRSSISVGKRPLTPTRNKSMELSRQHSVENPKITHPQSLHLNDKELNELLQGARTYSDKTNIKQLKEKMAYIERVYRDVQSKEQTLYMKEVECIFMELQQQIVKSKFDELEKMRHRAELKEIELKNRELTLETHPSYHKAELVASTKEFERTEKFAELQMKETLLGEQASLLQQKEKEIAAREKALTTKEQSIEDEYKRIQLIEEEIFQKEGELVDKMHKFEYDYAVVEARKNAIGETIEKVDLGINFTKLDPAEIVERARRKEEELTNQKRLLADKERYLVELQKNILRRETELLNQKAKLDSLQIRTQENESVRQSEMDRLKEKLKAKTKTLKVKESDIMKRENDINDKLQELSSIKMDIASKSKVLVMYRSTHREQIDRKGEIANRI